eukprot:NODE_47_length_3844_cov_23.120158_g41_i0.p1 GENE.NODE_47_length_3844_cov_23.120158_g41_i0~~NODE_47_length_3844_cov_23.120158_g41_i0.p1  ORF type:complete len:1208 (-),score=183.67 NODE_47_length_3844_cov_23.120158_g41_i0:85-3708(-)
MSSGVFAEHFSLGVAVGRGTYGSIFTCTHRRTGIAHMVKVVHKPELDPNAIESILYEAEIMRRLRHPHTVQLLWMFEEDEDIYLILDGPAEEPLSGRMVESFQLEESVAKQLVRNLLSAIRYLHDLQFCHRDIALDKLIVKGPALQCKVVALERDIRATEDSKANVAIADFAMCIPLGEPGPGPQRPSTEWVGTLDYLAPELIPVVRGHRAHCYDCASDLWSLGAVSFTLLCGHPPFYGRTEEALFESIRSGIVDFPVGVPKEAADFIKKLLTVDSARRMTSEEALGHPWLTNTIASPPMTPMHSNHGESGSPCSECLDELGPWSPEPLLCKPVSSIDAAASLTTGDLLERSRCGDVFALRGSVSVAETFSVLAAKNLLSCPIVSETNMFLGIVNTTMLLDLVLRLCHTQRIGGARDTPHRLVRLLHPNAATEFNIPVRQLLKCDTVTLVNVDPKAHFISFLKAVFTDPAECDRPIHRVPILRKPDGSLVAAVCSPGRSPVGTPLLVLPTFGPSNPPGFGSFGAALDCDSPLESTGTESSSPRSPLSTPEFPIVNFLTQSRVVQFITQRPALLGKLARRTLQDLGLADKPVCVVPVHMSTLHALMRLRKQNLTALGVVDRDGRLVGNLSASDVRGFTVQNIMNFALPVERFLARRSEGVGAPPKIVTCTSRGSFLSVLQLCTYHRIHRVYIVNTRNEPVSVVTLTDLLRALVHHFTSVTGESTPLPSPFPGHPTIRKAVSEEEFSELRRVVSIHPEPSGSGSRPRFRHREMMSKVFPEADGDPLVIVMVGLPGRGKSYISKRICRYLNWKGVPAAVFNAGEYRRQLISEECDASWFNPNNPEATAQREKMAHLAVDDLVSWLRSGGQVGILDATNTKRSRRLSVLEQLQQGLGLTSDRVLFLEIVCTDENIINTTIREVKLRNSDYKEKVTEASQNAMFKDFKDRIAHYSVAYEPLDINVGSDQRLSFISLVNVGERVLINRVHGSLPTSLLRFVMNLKTFAPPIYLCMHGDTFDTVQGKLGGNASLTLKGHEDAQRLRSFFDSLSKREARPQINVWTSTSRGCTQTCEVFANSDTYAVKHWKILEDLHFGECEGMTFAQVRRNLPDVWRSLTEDECFYTWPCGESPHTLLHRLEPVLLEAEASTVPLLFVASRHVCRCLYSYFRDVPLENCVKMLVPENLVFEVNIGISEITVKKHALEAFVPCST